MTQTHRHTTHNDPPEEVAAAIIIALRSLQPPTPAAPPSPWASSNNVAPAWHDHERPNLWRTQDRERGLRNQ